MEKNMFDAEKNKFNTKGAGRKASFCLFLLLIFVSCSTTKNVEQDAYYLSNVQKISAYTLSNNIPVIVRKTENSDIVVLRMIFEGGTPLVDSEKSGIESLTLDLCLQGSEKYSFDEIQKIKYENSFSISSHADRDYSVLGFKCLRKDFDTVLDLFADGILNPLFLQEDFDKALKLASQEYMSDMASPMGQLGIELEKAAFENSSYKSKSFFTEESLSSITMKDVFEHHKKLLDSRRIKFLVAGTFENDEEKLLQDKLETFFSKIPSGDFEMPTIQKIPVAGGNINLKNPNSGNSGYAAGYFDCPEKYDDDYVPFALCLMILDDLLFQKVREEAGAVYSIGCGILGGKELLGYVGAYKVSDRENIISLIQSTFDSFPSEKELEKILDRYKNKFITEIFKDSQSTSGIVSMMTSSLIYSGSCDTYLKRSAVVQNVTAKEVSECYRKYIPHRNKDGSFSSPIRWIMVTQ